jgi:hypothetical protein
MSQHSPGSWMTLREGLDAIHVAREGQQGASFQAPPRIQRTLSSPHCLGLHTGGSQGQAGQPLYPLRLD